MDTVYNLVHVFCDYNLAIILMFAALELWLIQHQINSEQFFLYNVINLRHTISTDFAPRHANQKATGRSVVQFSGALCHFDSRRWACDMTELVT